MFFFIVYIDPEITNYKISNAIQDISQGRKLKLTDKLIKIIFEMCTHEDKYEELKIKARELIKN